MIRGVSLAAALTVLVLATGVVSAAPRLQSTDPTLSTFTLSGITITRPFPSQFPTAYTGTVGPFETGGDVASTTVTATPTNSNATVVIKVEGVVISGTMVDLAAGVNAITVEVTAQDGSTMLTYEATVTRNLPFATRSFGESTVAPRGTLVVTMVNDHWGQGGIIIEHLPVGFTYVSSDNDALVTRETQSETPGSGQVWSFVVSTDDEKIFTYTLTAPDTLGNHTFAGTLRDFDYNALDPPSGSPEHTVGGDTVVTVATPPGVTFTPSSVTVNEGETGTYTVKLDTEPTGSVTVGVTSDNSEVTVSPTSLTFTATTWSNPQTVTVSAERDGDEVDETATISHAVSGYGSILTADSVGVTVTDLDEPGVSVSKPSLRISEGGVDTYTVVLGTDPGGDVTVTTASTNPDVMVSPVDLTFTALNWNAPQPVTVSAAEDSDAENDTATISHSVSGYGSVTTGQSVSVTVLDNEPRPTPTPEPRQPGSGTGDGDTRGPRGVAPSFTEGVTTTRTVPENAEPGTPVGDPLQATDPDSPSVTYSLASVYREFFSIDRLTGQLRTRVALDYETRNRYYLIVQAFSDDGTGGIRVIVEVTNDPNEPGEATATPTPQPVATPTPQPVATPTPQPVATPTPQPVATPTPQPVATPTPQPVATPTPQPIAIPTPQPTATPTLQPTVTPTLQPTVTPTPQPTVTPTPGPTATPTPGFVPIVETPHEGGGLPWWLWLLLLLLAAALVMGGVAYAGKRRRWPY